MLSGKQLDELKAENSVLRAEKHGSVIEYIKLKTITNEPDLLAA